MFVRTMCLGTWRLQAVAAPWQLQSARLKRPAQNRVLEIAQQVLTITQNQPKNQVAGLHLLKILCCDSSGTTYSICILEIYYWISVYFQSENIDLIYILILILVATAVALSTAIEYISLAYQFGLLILWNITSSVVKAKSAICTSFSLWSNLVW